MKIYNNKVTVSVFEKNSKYYLEINNPNSVRFSASFRNIIIRNSTFNRTVSISNTYRFYVCIEYPLSKHITQEITKFYYDLLLSKSNSKVVDTKSNEIGTFHLNEYTDGSKRYYMTYELKPEYRNLKKGVYIKISPFKGINIAPRHESENSHVNGVYLSCCSEADFYYTSVTKENWDIFWGGAPYPGYYSQNKLEYNFLTCKEQALREMYTVRNTGIETIIVLDNNNERSASDTVAKLNQWINQPGAAVSEKDGNILLTIEAGSWWTNGDAGDFYYKVGWLLLAVRIASGKESLDTDRLKRQFKNFIKKDYDESQYMDSENNWRNCY